jgi:general secretion pathway protein C
MKRGPLIASFILFIALCVSATYWGMQLFKPPLRAVAAPPPAVQSPLRPDAAAGLFGGRSTVAVATNFQLRGVVMSGTPKESIAILAADGKPAQAVSADREVMPGVRIKEVHARYVLLSDNGVTKRVELPDENSPQVKADTAAQPMPRAVPPLPAGVPRMVTPPVQGRQGQQPQLPPPVINQLPQNPPNPRMGTR